MGRCRRAGFESERDEQEEARADHPDTLTSMNNLAITWKQQRRHTEATKLMQDCVQLSKRILGVHHPSSLASARTLETIYFLAGYREYILANFTGLLLMWMLTIWPVKSQSLP